MSYLDKFTQALVAAIGFNDGANRGFWRVQWRDRLGRWAEMGRGVLSKVRMPNGEVMDMSGVFIGGSNRPGFGRVLVKGQSDKGIPDGVYEIGSNNGEIFQAKLTDETLERAGIEDTDTTTAQERLDSDIPNLADIVTSPITAEDEKLATDTPDDAQKDIIKEERAKSPIAKLPAGEEARMTPEELKAVLDGEDAKPTEAPEANDDAARLAVRKAFDDASFGEPVNLDDMIASMNPEAIPAARLKGMKINAKPASMQPGDIFTGRDGEEYSFESAGERDRETRTQVVNATNRKTGKSEEVILDTDVTTPVLRPDKNQPAPAPAKEKPAAAPEAPKATKEEPKAPEEAPKTPEAPKAPEAPEVPPVAEAPEEPSAPEEESAGKDRADNGQDIALPDVDENVLWAKKVAPLRDKAGNKVRAVDPDTGEYKSTFAEDPDAILNAILEKYPDAATLDDGGILVERTSFTDSDGIERKFESIIRRTKGSNYMVSYRITQPDGTQQEYFSHDFRDSFSSIHGKKNGIMRMSAILKGEQSPITNKKSKEYKAYFASGKLEDRLKYFRGKHASRATEDSLIANLKKAEARGKDDEIGLAQYNLDLLRNDFNGDINLYRKNAAAQTMRLLTLEETIDKYATGRFYLVNNASGKSNGTVLRSAVEGIYGGMKDGQVDGVKEALDELAGRLPDVSRNPLIARKVLDTLRDGIKKRFPAENQTALKALLKNGYNAWTTQDYNSDALDSAPHVAWDGNIISPNMLVEYTNNNNDKSVGIVHSVVPRAKNENPGSPNEYFDYVKVSFKGQDGKLQPPVVLSAKNMKVLDSTGISDVTMGQVTIHTPNLTGEEMRRARFGDKYMTAQKTRYADLFPGATDNISSGFSPRVVDPAQYVVDDLTPGGYLYDSEGLPVGQIAGVRDTTSATGEKGFTFAHVDPNGVVGFTSVKAGVARAPKADISKEDGRGSSASDEGFTPNPADFQDAGLDAEAIGSEVGDADKALLDLVQDANYHSTSETIISLAELAKLKVAQSEYDRSESDEDKSAAKETYKRALAAYYTRLAKHKAMSAKATGAAYSPDSIPSDSILEASDVAGINAKIAATQKPFEASEGRSNRTPATYDQLVQEFSKPENVYAGYLPDGWSAADPKTLLEDDTNIRKQTFTNMIDTFTSGTGQISAELMDAVTKRAQVETYSDFSGAIEAPKFHTLTNATGDKIQSYLNSNGNGYTASNEYVDNSASVINDVRSKLNVGDAPLTHVLINSSGAGIGSSGALGYVWTRDMWNKDENFANFHSVVDKINKFIAEFGVSPREEFVQGKSWFAVDLGQDDAQIRRYVTSHELGHVMQGKVLRNLGVTPGQREWDRLYGPVANSYAISQYGKSNYNEHFAESFARWELTGEANPKFLQFLADAGLLKSK